MEQTYRTPVLLDTHTQLRQLIELSQFKSEARVGYTIVFVVCPVRIDVALETQVVFVAAEEKR